jgi:hypothetical protein
MIQLALTLALVAQIQVPRAYTVADTDNPGQVDLWTENGLLTIELGPGCDWVAPDLNVEFLPGSGDVASLRPPGSNELCNVGITSLLSEQPCAQNADGDCDIAAETDQ